MHDPGYESLAETIFSTFQPYPFFYYYPLSPHSVHRRTSHGVGQFDKSICDE